MFPAIIAFLGLGFAVGAMFLAGMMEGRDRLNEWAKREGWTIVSSRYRPFMRDFSVVADDRAGKRFVGTARFSIFGADGLALDLKPAEAR
jgi:hypothetical protein